MGNQFLATLVVAAPYETYGSTDVYLSGGTVAGLGSPKRVVDERAPSCAVKPTREESESPIDHRRGRAADGTAARGRAEPPLHGSITGKMFAERKSCWLGHRPDRAWNARMAIRMASSFHPPC